MMLPWIAEVLTHDKDDDDGVEEAGRSVAW